MAEVLLAPADVRDEVVSNCRGGARDSEQQQSRGGEGVLKEQGSMGVHGMGR